MLYYELVMFGQEEIYMKILMIGGTGTISMEITRRLVELGEEVYLLNRGNRSVNLDVKEIHADIKDEADVSCKLAGYEFDAVADFIAFSVEDVARDARLFQGRTRQYIFVSTASAYQKPCEDYRISESTPLNNPYWEYSRKKAEAEKYLMNLYTEENFPVTIVRPSHTYDERKVPVGTHGKNGSWQVLKRMQMGKPVIIHGDGTSIWTMTSSVDFAVGFTGLIGNRKAIGQAVQIMTEEGMTWNQIYGIIADELGVKLNAVHISSEFLAACGSQYDFNGQLLGDKANTVIFDISKLKRLVPGFSQSVSMEKGIRKSVRFLLAHPELQIEDPDFDQWCDDVISARDEAIASLS